MGFLTSIKNKLRKIYSSPEKEVYLKIINHASLCAEATVKLRLFLKGLEMEKWNVQLLNDIHSLEREADKLRRSILEELSRSRLPPLIREDFVRLTERVDMVADWIKEAARILRALYPIQVPPTLLKSLIKLSEYCVGTSTLLKVALESTSKDYKKAFEVAKKVEDLEDKADSVYIGALRILARENPPANVLFERLIDAIENAVDSCEDSTDVLEGMIVRALR